MFHGRRTGRAGGDDIVFQIGCSFCAHLGAGNRPCLIRVRRRGAKASDRWQKFRYKMDAYQQLVLDAELAIDRGTARELPLVSMVLV